MTLDSILSEINDRRIANFKDSLTDGLSPDSKSGLLSKTKPVFNKLTFYDDEAHKFLVKYLPTQDLAEREKTISDALKLIEKFGASKSNYAKLSRILEKGVTSIDDLIEFGSFDFEGLFFKRLGSGVSGVTYLAHSENVGTDIAVKILPMDSYNPEEAKILESLRHENIVQIKYASKNLVKKNGAPVFSILMEYVDGDTIHELLKHNPGGFDSTKAFDYSMQLFNGIEYLISQNKFHRDITIKNVKINSEGLLKIIDFGIAERRLKARPKDNPRYGGEDDLFSWALITYEMYTGKHLISEKKPDENSIDHRDRVKLMKEQLRDDAGKLKNDYKRRIYSGNIPKELQNRIIESLEYSTSNDLETKVKSTRKSLNKLNPILKRKRTLRNRIISGVLGTTLLIAGGLGQVYSSWKEYNAVKLKEAETFFLKNHPLFDAMVNPVSSTHKLNPNVDAYLGPIPKSACDDVRIERRLVNEIMLDLCEYENGDLKKFTFNYGDCLIGMSGSMSVGRFLNSCSGVFGFEYKVQNDEITITNINPFITPFDLENIAIFKPKNLPENEKRVGLTPYALNLEFKRWFAKNIQSVKINKNKDYGEDRLHYIQESDLKDGLINDSDIPITKTTLSFFEYLQYLGRDKPAEKLERGQYNAEYAITPQPVDYLPGNINIHWKQYKLDRNNDGPNRRQKIKEDFGKNSEFQYESVNGEIYAIILNNEGRMIDGFSWSVENDRVTYDGNSGRDVLKNFSLDQNGMFFDEK